MRNCSETWEQMCFETVCFFMISDLCPKTAEIMRRKTEQVFADNGYCHTNGKFQCHTKQTGLVQFVVQTANSDDEQLRPVRPNEIAVQRIHTFFVRHCLRMVSESISEIFTHRPVFME
jgi:hypothetical protein